MSNTSKTPCSPQSITFRRLSKKDKYDTLLMFCMKNNTTPSTSNVSESERVLGQFYTNTKSANQKGLLLEWEIDVFNKILEYSPKQGNRVDKLNQIINYCNEYNKIPSQSSIYENEKILGRMLNRVMNTIKHRVLNHEEAELLESITKYRTKNIRSREDKLRDVLEFCTQHGRVPRQHVTAIEERRLAEFISTTRILHNKGKLDNICSDILTKINVYSHMSRINKMKNVLEFVKMHKVIPNTKSQSIEERKLASLFNNMKYNMKEGKLKKDEIDIILEIMRICNIKTRLEKIKELCEYVNIINRLPTLNSHIEEERKYAMIFNYSKHAHRNGRLCKDEVDLVTTLNKYTQ